MYGKRVRDVFDIITKLDAKRFCLALQYRCTDEFPTYSTTYAHQGVMGVVMGRIHITPDGETGRYCDEFWQLT
jgi:hypothetical protein